MISLELQAPELNNNHVRLHVHDQFPFRFPPYLIPVAVVALVVPKYLTSAAAFGVHGSTQILKGQHLFSDASYLFLPQNHLV